MALADADLEPLREEVRAWPTDAPADAGPKGQKPES
jgi:hypothetical protein